MNYRQDQKSPFKHYSTMPLRAKLALIGAIIAVGVVMYLVAQ